MSNTIENICFLIYNFARHCMCTTVTRAITLMQFPNCITTYGQLTEIHGGKKSPCRVIWVQKIIGFTQECLQE